MRKVLKKIIRLIQRSKNESKVGSLWNDDTLNYSSIGETLDSNSIAQLTNYKVPIVLTKNLADEFKNIDADLLYISRVRSMLPSKYVLRKLEKQERTLLEKRQLLFERVSKAF